MKLSRTVPFMVDVVTKNEQFFIPYHGICVFIPKPYINLCPICNGCIMSPNQSIPLKNPSLAVVSCKNNPIPWFIANIFIGIYYVNRELHVHTKRSIILNMKDRNWLLSQTASSMLRNKLCCGNAFIWLIIAFRLRNIVSLGLYKLYNWHKRYCDTWLLNIW